MAHRLTVLVAVAALATASPQAYAATGSPPVTSPDHVTLYAGESEDFDLTANDTDPDGDELAACRLGADVPRKLEVAIALGRLVVSARNSARGSYMFTYYACDASYLTPAQVTVEVRPPRPALEVIQLEARPGRFRIVNTYKHRTFRCQWHPFDDETVEGRVTVRPQSSVVIEARGAEVQVDCTGASGLVYSFGFDKSQVTQR